MAILIFGPNLPKKDITDPKQENLTLATMLNFSTPGMTDTLFKID